MDRRVRILPMHSLLPLLLLALLASSRPATAASPSSPLNSTSSPFVPCSYRAHTFLCDLDDACIPADRVCNGVRDCADGQDEYGCNDEGGKRREDIVCEEGYFKCAAKHECVSHYFVCDGEYDCKDRSDEKNCDAKKKGSAATTCPKEEFLCKPSGLCLPNGWKCDGNEDCEDNSDEAPEICGVGDGAVNDHGGGGDHSAKCNGDDMFHCGDGDCIAKRWVCDKHQDCKNNADEASCHDDCLASEGKFQCLNGNACLNASQVCDNHNDCGDNSDEGTFCQTGCKAGNKCEHDCMKTPKGDACYCDPGFNVTENGACRDVNECENFGVCSQDCRNTRGSYQCKCRSGYHAEDSTGTCTAYHGRRFLFFSTKKDVRAIVTEDDGDMRKLSLVRELERDMDPSNPNDPIGVAFDAIDNRVYWTAIKDKKEGILYSRLGSSEIDYLVNDGLVMPEGIAVDYIGRNVYFTDSTLSIVGVANIYSKLWTPLIRQGLEKPRAIALFPEKGLMFISDWGNSFPRIIRADMNGRNVRSIVDSGVKWPNGLAVDKVQERIYFSDAFYDTLESVKLDGSDRRPVIANNIHHPFSIAIFEDTLYWSDWHLKEIRSCNKYTGKDSTTIVKEPLITPMGISVYHYLMEPHMDSPCLANLCSHLCLLAPRGAYSCHCPNNGTLKADNHNCVEEATMIQTTSSTTRSPGKKEFEEAENRHFDFDDHHRHHESTADHDHSVAVDENRKEDEGHWRSHHAASETTEDRLAKEKLIIGIVVAALVVLLALCIFCFVRRGRRVANGGGGVGESSPAISARFSIASFRRGKLGGNIEELKNVSVEPFASSSKAMNELHNPIYTSVTKRSSASDQDIYKTYDHWANTAMLSGGDSPAGVLKRAETNPDFGRSIPATSTSSLLHVGGGGKRTLTMDSRKSDDASKSDSTMDEDDGDSESMGNYNGDTEQLLH